MASEYYSTTFIFRLLNQLLKAALFCSYQPDLMFLPFIKRYGTLSLSFSKQQMPYDPLPVPPSCVWHIAPLAVPLGSLGDYQSIVVHP
jgi:hypothetical protein